MRYECPLNCSISPMKFGVSGIRSRQMIRRQPPIQSGHRLRHARCPDSDEAPGDIRGDCQFAWLGSEALFTFQRVLRTAHESNCRQLVSPSAFGLSPETRSAGGHRSKTGCASNAMRYQDSGDYGPVILDDVPLLTLEL